jgi:uracil-DNA glycosylase
MKRSPTLAALDAVHAKLKACRKCPHVCARAVHGPALETKVMLIGQAPGIHEGVHGRPFAHTAGKTLFKWLREATGAEEAVVRELVYFSAVARCFPGKAPGGKGDRAPSTAEIENCAEHLRAEIEALRPALILAVGKVAITETLAAAGLARNFSLEEVVGRKIRTRYHGHEADVIALPHPSGVSRWPHTPTGKKKLAEAFLLLREELRPLL